MIIVNKIKCVHCGDVIESKTTHDFKWCSCGSVAVDGGKSYLKRASKDKDDYIEMSVSTPDTSKDDEEDDEYYD